MFMLVFQKVTFCFADVNIIADAALQFVNYFRIHERTGYIFETESIPDSIWWLKNDILHVLFARSKNFH